MDWKTFVEHLQKYESDTFSAESSKITPEEAESVAKELLGEWVENKLDGTMIESYLEYIRPVEDEEE